MRSSERRSSNKSEGTYRRNNSNNKSNHRYRNLPWAPNVPAKKLDSNENMPMLTFETSSNFAIFREKLLMVCLEKYGDLGRLIEDKEYYTPDPIEIDNFTPKPREKKYILKKDLASAYINTIKRRVTHMFKMRVERLKRYAYIWLKLSAKSVNEVK